MSTKDAVQKQSVRGVGETPGGRPDQGQPVYIYSAFPPEEDSGIDFAALFRRVIRYWYVIVLTTAVMTGLAVREAALAIPIYRAEVLMMPVGSGAAPDRARALADELGGLAAFVGLEPGAGAGMEYIIATLRSRRFTSAFLKEDNVLPELFKERWDSANNKWAVANPEDIPTLQDGYKVFNRIRRVERREKNLLVLSIEWHDRYLAAKWANELVEAFNRHQRLMAVEEAEKSIVFLKKELEKTSIADIQHIIYRLIEAQGKKIMLANVRDDYVLDVIDWAAVPEEHEYVRPDRNRIRMEGALKGLLLGLILALVLSFAWERWARPAERGAEN